MTARKAKAGKPKPKITLSEPDGRPYSGLVVGPARIVPAALRRAGVPWMWDNSRRGYLVSRTRLADVEAVMVADGHRVESEHRQQVLL